MDLPIYYYNVMVHFMRGMMYTLSALKLFFHEFTVTMWQTFTTKLFIDVMLLHITLKFGFRDHVDNQSLSVIKILEGGDQYFKQGKVLYFQSEKAQYFVYGTQYL